MKAKLFLVMLLFPTLASAYQTELRVDHHRADYEGEQEFTGTALILKHYFIPVELNNSPYHEAEFLNRSSSVELLLGQSEFTFSNYLSMDGPLYGAEIFLMKKGSNYYFNGGFLFSKLENETYISQMIEMETDSLHIEPGYFVNDSTLVSLSYYQTNTALLDTTIESSEIALKVKSVINNFNIESEIVQLYDESEIVIYDDKYQSDVTNMELSLNLDYYINKNASMGVGFISNSGDDKDNEGETLILESVVYINKTFGIGFEYSKFSGNFDNNENSITVGAKLRLE